MAMRFLNPRPETPHRRNLLRQVLGQTRDFARNPVSDPPLKNPAILLSP